MKKYILVVTVVIISALFMLPSLLTRIAYEENHKTFVMAADIEDFENLKLPDGFNESGISAVYVRNTEYLEAASSCSLPIALEVYPGTENIEELFLKYPISFVVLREGEGKTFCDLTEVIKKYKPVIVLYENFSQNGNETPPEFFEIFSLSEGRLLRCYETLEYSVVSDKSYDACYYQMLNSAYERNTEFIVVNLLKDGESYEENIIRTQRSAKCFNEKMLSLGYKKEFSTPSPYYYEPPECAFFGAVILLLLCIIMLGYESKKTVWLLTVTAFFAFGITYVMPDAIILVYAGLSPVFMVILTKRLKDKLPFYFLAPVILISVLFLGAIISALLSGLKYYMCVKFFYGVAISLITAPSAALYLTIKEYGIKNFAEFIKKNIWIVVFLLFVIFVYILRSNNTKISDRERIIRNFLTEMAVSRPRTKEFLIGWPCFYLYLIKKDKKNILSEFILITGTAILFSSQINSFCHVFTDFSASFLRAVNGFLFALPVIVVIELSKRCGFKRGLRKILKSYCKI